MREILFRGKRVDNGEWVYGNLNKTYSGYTSYVVPKKKSLIYVHPDDFNAKRHNLFSIQIESDNGRLKDIKVDEKTIGQFTGLTDKNGVKIFEGDVLSIYGIEGNPVVYFDEQMACFRIKTHLKHHDGTSITFGFEEAEPNSEIDVIGNIHDNPEL